MASVEKPVPTIPPEIEAKLAEIEALCRYFGVRRLDLFGSAATGPFDRFTSDYDFLAIHPDDDDYGPWMGRFQDLERELRWLMGSPVDLVRPQDIQRGQMRDSIERSRVMIFHD